MLTPSGKRQKKDNNCYIVDSLSLNVSYLIYKTLSMVLAEKSTERKAIPDTNCCECTVDSLVFTNGPVAEKKDLRTYVNSKDPD